MIPNPTDSDAGRFMGQPVVPVFPPSKREQARRAKTLKIRKVTQSDEPYIIEMWDAGANMSDIAKALGVSRSALVEYCDLNMKSQMVDMKQGIIDKVESRLLENCDNGDQKAIEFFLKSQAKDRGYGDVPINVPTAMRPTINIGRIEIVGDRKKTVAPDGVTVEAEVVDV